VVKLKGFSKESFILFYLVFILFVAYVSGLAGYDILKNTEAIKNLPEIEPSNIFSVILVPFQYFISLILISTEYTLLFTILLLPMTATLIWIILSWLRGI